MENPYRRVHRRTRRRSKRGWAWVFLVFAAGLAIPLSESILSGFVQAGRLDSGFSGIATRLALLMVAAMALHSYTDLVRGSDRRVLDPHPVRARLLVRALAWRTGTERIYLPLICAVLLLPLASWGHWVHYGAGMVLIFSGYWVGLGVGQATHLGAVWAARSGGLARTLDLLRGTNPRMQAALIYAPGFAFGLAGGAILLSAAGMEAALGGWSRGWWWMMIPWAVGAVGVAFAAPLGERYYVRTTSLLGEIDSMYAGLESAEENRAVYLDWLARRDIEMLRTLRHGWRGARIWPVGAWVLGFLLGGLALDPDSEAVRQAAIWGSAGVLSIVAVIFRLASEDPEWLDRALCLPRRRTLRSRAIVGFLYAQGVIVPVGAALWFRHGSEAQWVVLSMESMAVGAAFLAAIIAGRWRGPGIWIYGPLGILIWALGLGGQM